MKSTKIVFTLAIILLEISNIQNTHIYGVWNTQDFFKFISKFGSQKTEVRDPQSSGYVYGNVTAKYKNPVKPATLVAFRDSQFIPFYNNRTILDKEKACHVMFSNISNDRCDKQCCSDKVQFLQEVPCNKGRVCENRRNSMDHVVGAQFSFELKDFQYPKFWFLAFVSCYQDRDACGWHHMTETVEIEYDIWLVNGSPNGTSYYPFSYQFSFEKQDTVQLYLLFFIMYGLLMPVQVYAMTHQRHPVTRLFTISLCLEFLGISMNLLNSLKFAIDGKGFKDLAVAGDILDILARTTFMLLLLLLSKGWAVTRIELSWRPFVFIVWSIYGTVHLLLYIWNMSEVDVVTDVDEYQTWPGLLILGLRFIIIIWFILELRNTMRYEHNSRKLNFFLHFGASALVWLIYLPIIAAISLKIHPLWRFKLLLGVIYAADCLAYCVMTHLLWPTRSEQYFLLSNTMDTGGDELDVFNEAPHILNSRRQKKRATPQPSEDALIDINH